jgi:predicted GNAT family acetyltransferase
MEIQHERQERTGRFYIEEDKKTVAEMDYNVLSEKELLIVHTEVDKMLAGKGVGRKLVETIVNYARENSISIRATCPYAKKVLDNSPEFADVYH